MNSSAYKSGVFNFSLHLSTGKKENLYKLKNSHYSCVLKMKK